MDVSLGVVVIEDSFGAVVVCVAQSPESHVAFGGTMTASSCLKDANGKPVLFAGRAGGVLAWAEEHGLKCETHAVTLDTKTRQVKNWLQV
jgi:hypothetical protein